MLLLTESDAQELLPMTRALECVAAAFMAQHSGGAVNHPRRRIFLPGVSLHYMAAALPGDKLLGLKIYTISRSQWRFVVLLYDAESGELLALVEADQLGRIRTGAASGVATRLMAREDASRVGMIGTGRQARTQLQAVAGVRELEAVRVYGRDPARRETFARELAAQMGIPVEAAGSAEEAARFGQIVITATSSSEPVLRGEWLNPGAHVNAIGANMANRRELDAAALARSTVIAVDSLEQARVEAGDLIQGLAELGRDWDGVLELHEIAGGARSGRNSGQDVTLFKSTGLALWDVAAAGYVYRQALERGMGRQIKMWA